jgi:medium-chain acyl-[acyl-carrier-protein] hydrolase
VNSQNFTPVITDQWVSCSRPNSKSRIRLFCFPYAGAGSSLFNAWSKWLLPEIELYLVNLPGRDARIREAPYRQLQPLISPLTQGLLPYLDKPFCFFGHSMGALISFEVVRELRREHQVQPLHLFVSGHPSPQLPASNPILYDLPENDFLSTVQQTYGALPELILQDPELLGLFLPMLRADITLVETYEYKQEEPLAFPVSVYGGVQDTSVTEKELAAWREQTTASFRMKMFPGEHFYLQTARSLVLQEINTEFARMWNGYRNVEGVN